VSTTFLSRFTTASAAANASSTSPFDHNSNAFANLGGDFDRSHHNPMMTVTDHQLTPFR
jgi:hypothetical protein